jgi:hypothetical protein
MFRLMKALAMAGLICMVRTLFGQNPSVSLKNLTSPAISGSSIDIGFTKGAFIFKMLNC